ncbi:MAG: hypothetical protein DCC68_09650 [Planctomycetota bacterium]|nr:MAG: hypothetical protein DCC68_09650 [Planctomycetota bacterium]
MPIDASPSDGAPQPPSDMPRRWAERPQPTESAAYPPVQTNPHYADTLVAPTPTRTADNRPIDDRAYSDGRSADPRIADGRIAPQPTSEQLEAERRAYENNRRRAYEFSRDRAQAERQPLPESYRR